jgi:hypothetical protein
MNVNLYGALLDETWRFTIACRGNRAIRPTIYRAGRTFQLYGAEVFADQIWLYGVELVWDWIHVHGRIPYIEDHEWQCLSEDEWIHLLVQSSVHRNVYFTNIIADKRTIPLTYNE